MHRNGFNLIELMIVVAIMGIIAAVAVPIYTNYVYRSKQVEAKTLLMTIKVEEEQFRAENNCYTTDVADLPETNRLYPNNRVYKTTPTIAGANVAPCNAAQRANDFQATVSGNLAAGRPSDKWGISDLVPAPLHCDGRSSYSASELAACPGGTTTEIEY